MALTDDEISFYGALLWWIWALAFSIQTYGEALHG